MQTSKLKQLSIATALAAFLASCGQESRPSDMSSIEVPAHIQASSQIPELLIPVALGGPALTLTSLPASAYTISLEDCASGHTSTVTESVPDLYVYREDVGCLAKLVDFSIDGSGYVQQVGSEFTDWLPGDTAIFEDGFGNEMIVEVVKQLSSPASALDDISYKLSGLASNAPSISFMDMLVGPAVPEFMFESSFNVDSVSWIGLDEFTQAGQYQFTLECKDPLTNFETECDGYILENLRYRLVPDYYGGAPTLLDLESLFPVIPDPDERAVDFSDIIGIGQQGLANGGFITKGDFEVLVSPDDLSLPGNNDLLFVLEIEDGLDYIYWTFDIDTGHVTP